MAIRQTTNLSGIDSAIEERAKKATLLKFHYTGEACIRQARLHGSYTDRTGNLRSSIGYVIVENGKVEEISGFPEVKGGATGSQTGKSYALSLASKQQGVALIVVAGMSYASYVQRKGYDVTVSAELLAEQLLSQLGLSNAKIKPIQ